MSGLEFDCRHRFASGFELAARFTARGGVTALFGPSGAGKSTCLSIIAGVLRPDVGRVTLDDIVIIDAARRIFLPPEQRSIGIVFQEHRLFPHLTVAENLQFGRQRNKSSAIDFRELVETLELGSFLDRYPRQLSGGQQQRVALGRGILRGPKLLLMDEPLAALDVSLKERVLVYLERALVHWKIPTLFVSHDQVDVRRLAERVIIIEDGKVVDAGPTTATLDAAVTTKLQYRPGPLNLLRLDGARLVENHWEGQIAGHPIRLSVDPANAADLKPPVYVQFLPSDVTLSRTPVEGLSIRNQWPGQVREIVALGERLFVSIDVGTLIWAEITAQSAQELALAAGAAVTCLIKTAAVRLAV